MKTTVERVDSNTKKADTETNHGKSDVCDWIEALTKLKGAYSAQLPRQTIGIEIGIKSV